MRSLIRKSIFIGFGALCLLPPCLLKAEVPKQKPSLVLYYRPTCPYCKNVLRFLNSVKKTVPLKNIGTDSRAKDELIKNGGKKQVPCLFIDGKPLYESKDIINYLANHVSDL